MTTRLTHERADQLVRESLLTIVPDADFAVVGPDDDLRAELELDSLDFLAFVEQLSQRSGRRIDEDDYDRLGTLSGCATFLSGP